MRLKLAIIGASSARKTSGRQRAQLIAKSAEKLLDEQH
jgi:hypothetical protein